jgi:hypothetical protein
VCVYIYIYIYYNSMNNYFQLLNHYAIILIAAIKKYKKDENGLAQYLSV